MGVGAESSPLSLLSPWKATPGGLAFSPKARGGTVGPAVSRTGRSHGASVEDGTPQEGCRDLGSETSGFVTLYRSERPCWSMCGRTSCHLPRDALTRACAYDDRQGRRRLPQWRDPDKYSPSYNKSPQSSSPVLLSRLHLEKVRRVVGLGACGPAWQWASDSAEVCPASRMTLKAAFPLRHTKAISTPGLVEQ